MYKYIENIRLAIRAILGKKIRSFLTMLGVIIGVFAIVLLIGIGEGVKSEVTGQIEGLGSNIVMIMPGAGGFGSGGPMNTGATFTLEDVAVVESVDNIEYIIPMSVVPLPVSASKPVDTSQMTSEEREMMAQSAAREDVGIMEQAQSFVTALGTTEDVEKAFAGGSLDQGESFGRMFNADEYASAQKVVSLQYGAVDTLFPGQDASAVLGNTVYIGKEPFEVIGAQNPPEAENLFDDGQMSNMAIIPLSTVDALTDETNISQIAITITNADHVDAVKEEVRLALLEAHDGVEDFSLTTQEELLSMFDEILGVLTTMLGGIAAISLLVGGIGVMNIMLVSVTERTKEIGLRKAIGASGSDILLQFLIEAVLLTFLGGAVGIGLAYVGSAIMDAQWGLAAKITLEALVLAFAFTTLIGIFFGVAPAIRAARLDPINALKYE